MQDLLQHLIGLLKHLIIAETEYAKAKPGENLLAFLVSFYLLLMHLSIHFNNESRLEANKVNDKAVDPVLSMKAMPAQLAIAQPLPEHLFSGCGFVAHLPGNSAQLSAKPGIPRRVMFHHRMNIACFMEVSSLLRRIYAT